jgi:hypothetical protein
MDDTAVRAARVMNSQAAMLRRRMETAKPQGAPEESGMLFKRTVQLPPNTDLERLLEKWNPGVPPSTLADLVSTVCRWNQLKSPTAIQPGQQLLIPTVIPHGQEPSAVGARPGAAILRGPSAPLRSNMAMSSQLAEQRMRSVSGNVAGAATIWATGNQAGQNLAGAKVKQQFQANLWNRRA